MPLYEYRCSKCHQKMEILQKVGETPAKKCPYCGGTLKKLLSTPAIQFKGSGWYVTDYAKNHSSSPDSKKTKPGSPAESTPAKKEKNKNIKTQNNQ